MISEVNTYFCEMQRFVDAQKNTFVAAFAEMKAGRKRTHWMWYIFPQLAGLGQSETSKYYGIKSLAEAQDYLNHPVLGTRLIDVCNVLLELKSNDATKIFGSPDDVKLKSSMTLFSLVKDASPVFQKVLGKFFDGQTDQGTLGLL
jgi:uncharacterized protein (DUF1810 family)